MKIIKENWATIEEIEKKVQEKTGDPEASNNKQRLISIAQTKLEEACMFAVKAIYAD